MTMMRCLVAGVHSHREAAECEESWACTSVCGAAIARYTGGVVGLGAFFVALFAFVGMGTRAGGHNRATLGKGSEGGNTTRTSNQL